MSKISISTRVAAEPASVWNAWTDPAHIVQWNFASDDWCCPKAEIDLRVGGRFQYRMEARDGSMGFDFEGTFTGIDPERMIEYELEDGRAVVVRFTPAEGGILVEETFDAENELSGEQQRQGWQRILDQFKSHVESSGT